MGPFAHFLLMLVLMLVLIACGNEGATSDSSLYSLTL